MSTEFTLHTSLSIRTTLYVALFHTKDCWRKFSFYSSSKVIRSSRTKSYSNFRRNYKDVLFTLITLVLNNFYIEILQSKLVFFILITTISTCTSCFKILFYFILVSLFFQWICVYYCSCFKVFSIFLYLYYNFTLFRCSCAWGLFVAY